MVDMLARPSTHADRGRALENAGMILGMIVTVILVLAGVAIWLGLVPHPGQEIPKWLVLVVLVPYLPKGAALATKGGIWKLLPRGK